MLKDQREKGVEIFLEILAGRTRVEVQLQDAKSEVERYRAEAVRAEVRVRVLEGEVRGDMKTVEGMDVVM